MTQNSIVSTELQHGGEYFNGLWQLLTYEGCCSSANSEKRFVQQFDFLIMVFDKLVPFWLQSYRHCITISLIACVTLPHVIIQSYSSHWSYHKFAGFSSRVSGKKSSWKFVSTDSISQLLYGSFNQ